MTLDMTSDLLRMSVQCDEYAPRVVRDAMSGLDGLGWVLGDAMLVASEIVSNAVLHSRCTAEDLLSIRVSRDGRLRISVVDPGESGHEAKIAERSMDLGGLGLKIVDQLADDWGAERGYEGHQVWAELSLASG